MKEYKAPSLVLKNIEVRNFLEGYSSLIHVETDNYESTEDDFG